MKSREVPNQPLRIGVAQTCSTDDVAANVDAALAAVARLKGSDLIVFPENALFLRMDRGPTLTEFDLSEKFWVQFQEAAKRQRAHVMIGSVALQSAALKSRGKPTNSTIWIDTEGAITAPYSKIHLFDVDVEGAPAVRESDAFAHGEKPRLVEINGWRVGLSICYDVRFSNLYHEYARQNAHLILVPSAFLVPTGQAHWHTLLRARAIESQAFVVAAAQSGGHRGANGKTRETFGHSLVIDPWGAVLAELASADAAEKLIQLDPDLLTKVWRQIPMASHRRNLNTEPS
jgi:predicted amidohydrolase